MLTSRRVAVLVLLLIVALMPTQALADVRTDPTPQGDLITISGPTRLETAASLADVVVGTAAHDVVLAPAETWEYALASSFLLSRGSRPRAVLLATTGAAALPDTTATYIAEHDVQQVLVVAPSSVIPDSVLGQLADMGVIANRVVTVTNPGVMSEQVATTGGGSPTEMFIASDSSFADALAASGVAARRGAPILLNGASQLSVSTTRYLDGPGASVETVYVVGGTVVLSDQVVDQLNQRGLRVVRLSGPSRVETAVAIGLRFQPAQKSAIVARGDGFADALSAATLARGRDLPILLTANAATESTAADFFAGVSLPCPAPLFVAGGEAAVQRATALRISARSC